jgi:alpha-L-fucosidase 2
MTLRFLSNCILCLFISISILERPLAEDIHFKTDIAYSPSADPFQKLDIAIHEDPTKILPCIFLIHGGGFTGGDKKTFFTSFINPLFQAGYQLVNINYRLAPQSRYPACVDDCKTALQWVIDHAAEYRIDPKKITLLGGSAGAFLVSKLAVDEDCTVKIYRVVSFFAPYDLVFQCEGQPIPNHSITALFGDTQFSTELWKKLKDISPLTKVRPGLPPFLSVHGTADDSVLYQQSIRFDQLMKQHNNDSTLITVENGKHGIQHWDSVLKSDYQTRVLQWLEKTK